MIRLIALIFAIIISSTATAEQFSIMCERQASLQYLTFDTETNRVIYESAGATYMKGTITSSSQNEISFELFEPGRPKYELIWRAAERNVTIIGLPNSPERPTSVMKCDRTSLRNVLPFYDGIAPMK